MHSYPKVYAIGHKAVRDLLTAPVIVEEKIDGSQISFGLIDGALQIRSKSAEVFCGNPGMFEEAVKTVLSIESLLIPGWSYRGEYLSKPKHNTLAYDRVPNKHIILFDVDQGDQDYLRYEFLEPAAAKLGLEVVPLLFQGMLTQDKFNELLDRTSVLGGQKIEGVVIKQADTVMFASDGKALIAKYVSEKFKEIHGHEWRQANPVHGDVIDLLIDKYRTPARWEKAIQHRRDNEELENCPTDIGPLIKMIQEDTKLECEDEIKEALFAHAWKRMSRGVTAGFAEYYKKKLAEQQFLPV